MADEKWIPITDAVGVLGKTERTLRRWVASRRLQSRSDNDGHLLVDVSSVTGARQAQPDIAGVTGSLQAELFELRAKLQAVEQERDALRDERDFLRRTLESEQQAHARTQAIAMQTQRLLPAPRNRPWWRFWERDEEAKGEG